MERMTTWLLALSGALCGCADESDAPGLLEIRPAEGEPAVGTHLSCTEVPAGLPEPCGGGKATSGTGAAQSEPGVIVLSTGRSAQIPAQARLQLELRFSDDGSLISAAAWQKPALGGPRVMAIDGWISPDALSPLPTGRNAGRYEISFRYGEYFITGALSGSYDTDANMTWD